MSTVLLIITNYVYLRIFVGFPHDAIIVLRTNVLTTLVMAWTQAKRLAVTASPYLASIACKRMYRKFSLSHVLLRSLLSFAKFAYFLKSTRDYHFIKASLSYDKTARYHIPGSITLREFERKDP